MAPKELIKIISINVNSIITNQKRYELLELLNQHNPHIACLCETKLNQNHQLSFKNYHLLRRDRPYLTRRGRTAILVKNNIAYEEIKFQTHDFCILENCAIKIKITEGKMLNIVATNAHHDNRTFIKKINGLFQQNEILSNSNYFLLVGDLNARHKQWGDTVTNTRGAQIQNWINEKATNLRLELLPPAQPIFNRSQSLLDIGIIDNRLQIQNLVENSKIQVVDYTNDHQALLIEINIKNCTV